ncbi:hypothetical protein H9Q72_005169 [Fusarium xylarioides]|uniref:Uncharacterized protein n=1 Tax=Fusarium xylarioides TaxID=221167 RepID=A0A9P7LLL8_9HYPO|nr:hypothetical protein H9Q72_005169 [Fusarium xylarioides]KAG5815028.1 hypothetical protein H9Q71_002921 [Fusarium xylarioides]KAG5826934.1 hypothetical protein H9Q74_002955 [Fusarium xylarioides]
MQCVLEATSALRPLIAALTNPCRTTSRNPDDIAPVVQAQELVSNRELLTLSYRVQAAPEIHDNATIEENIRQTVSAYARECREANAFVAVLERLPTAFETPADREDRDEKAKLPPMELPDEFIDVMDRLIAEGNQPARNTVRTIQGPVRHGAAQDTPQKRQRALKEDNDEVEESSIWDSEAPELMAPSLRWGS